MPKFIEDIMTILKGVLLSLVVIFAALVVITLFRPAFGATPAEDCDIKGGVWNGKYCLARDMTDEEITFARRYTLLKQIESREIKNDRSRLLR